MKLREIVNEDTATEFNYRLLERFYRNCKEIRKYAPKVAVHKEP